MNKLNKKTSKEKAKMTIDLIASNTPIEEVYSIFKEEFKDEPFKEIESTWDSFFEAVRYPENDSNDIWANDIWALVYNSRLDALAKLAIKEFNPSEKDEKEEFLARELLIIQSGFSYKEKKKLLLEAEGSEDKVYETVTAAGLQSMLTGNTYLFNKANEMLKAMENEMEF